MAHFAQIDENNTVIQVIVVEQEVIDTGLFGDPAAWIQTSYNTYGGVHILGGTPFRKNYAGIGYTYDLDRDAFISPKPYPSWLLDEDTCEWNSPVTEPTDGEMYDWNEETQSWDLISE